MFSCCFREEKKKVGPSGGTPSTWVHYAKVHSILGAFKINNIEPNMLESTSKFIDTLTTQCTKINNNFPTFFQIYHGVPIMTWTWSH